ncbi:MAG: hypothetical protein ACTSWJ_02360 [Candidatus Heimdallarchaeaceae archaeon]
MLLKDAWKKSKVVVMVIEREKLIKRQLGLKSSIKDFDTFSKLNTQSLKCLGLIIIAEKGSLGNTLRKIFGIDDKFPIRFSALGSSLVVNDDTNNLSYLVSKESLII